MDVHLLNKRGADTNKGISRMIVFWKMFSSFVGVNLRVRNKKYRTFVFLLVLVTVVRRNMLGQKSLDAWLMGENQNTGLTEFHLLVHYSYFEEGRTALCDVLTKRLNLATFLKVAVKESKNIFFTFTVSGRLPTAASFYNSINIEPIHAGTIFPHYKNVEVRFVDYSEHVPDLCHHANAIKKISRRRTRFDFVLFLNDGVRGPLHNGGNGPMEEFGDVDDFYGVPKWLSELATLLLSDPLIMAVAPVLSCEIDLHLQGWYVLSKVEILDWWIPAFKETCDPNKPWAASIRKEVGFTQTILRNGGKVAALFPDMLVVSLDDSNSLKKIWRSKKANILRRRLYGCKNPLVAQQMSQKALDVEKLSAIKYGGNFYRLDIFNHRTKALVDNITSNILGYSRGDDECWIP